jgi:DNA-binding transcriptional regulator GbsR (MarR family)
VSFGTPFNLTPALQKIIEKTASYFEHYGFPRVAGRIYGLNLISDRPLSIDDMAYMLKVSRTSISTNMRILCLSELVESVSLPGDRRDYYQIAPDAWERYIEMNTSSFDPLLQIAQEGLEVSDPSSMVHERLLELVDFCEFSVQDGKEIIDRWRKYRQQCIEKRQNKSNNE